MRRFLATLVVSTAIAATASVAFAAGPSGGPGNGGGPVIDVQTQNAGVQTTTNDQSTMGTPSSDQSSQPFVYRQGAR